MIFVEIVELFMKNYPFWTLNFNIAVDLISTPENHSYIKTLVLMWGFQAMKKIVRSDDFFGEKWHFLVF